MSATPRQKATQIILAAIAAIVVLLVVTKDTGLVRGSVTDAGLFCALALDTDQPLEQPMTRQECVDAYDSLDDEYLPLAWGTVL